MRILVTGASGFVGSLLVPRLRAQGHTVRALGRDPERVRAALARTGARAQRDDTPATLESVEVVRADALSAEGLAEALADVEVAYYLIHSMEPSTSAGSAFPERERIAAENFAAAASREGVRRVVYLGGLVPHSETTATARTDMHISRHLASRAQVEHILLGAIPDSLALRASIVIGARSRSFRLLVHLLERMPVLTLPAWHALRTRPIDERDAIEMLSQCASSRLSGRSLDIGGPDVLTYGEMLSTIAELMLVNRPTITLGVNLTAVTARVAAAIAGEDPELVLPLMEGLNEDLLPADDHAAELLGVRLHSFDSAVEHALAEWEHSESLAAR
jgi:uncharacterized protein YbjT (DUF2867 family)